MYENLTMKMKI